MRYYQSAFPLQRNNTQLRVIPHFLSTQLLQIRGSVTEFRVDSRIIFLSGPQLTKGGTRRPKGGRWQTVGLVDKKGRRCVLPAATNGLALGWGEKRKDVDPSEQWRTWACLVNGGRVLANGSDM